ncbi:glycosyltransferase family 9 protein [Vibrio splendidus]|uniref:glycosyltransferase family 9 protein n=1 Tax=Vibrio splendidus TaxID=29497 RepID=UPI0009771C64|nr:glycosyltransferase family 9 protein [Vibrio splendidus]OMO27737.1 glycosyl transferase [Vibrio splendidus]PMH10179.1 glycosyl transferase [Vibrio splendidus]
MSLFNSAPRSLCILRLSAIGDVCNTIASVQAIQSYWPETKITWITGRLEAQLLEAVDGLEIIIFDKKGGWQEYKKLWLTLQGRQFDALLHMQYALRASIATLGIKAKYKLGFDTKRSQDFQTLFTNVKVPSPESMHVLDGLMSFAFYLGVPEQLPTWTLKCTPEQTLWAKAQIKSQVPNLVIVPATSKSYKNWTIEGYVALIEHAQQSGWNIVLSGSPATIEVQLAKSIEERLTTQVYNLVGKSSLLEMLALIKEADLIVAPDTGPTHMANAIGTPVIGLYAHHNPKRTGPYNSLHAVVSVYEDAIAAEHPEQVEQLDWRTRVKDDKAMKRIKADSVIAMFDKMANAIKK